METPAVGIHAPSKREVWAVVPAEYLLSVVFKELNLDTRRGFKRLTLCGFKPIGWVGDEFHGRYGAALSVRCQLPFSCPTSARTATSFIDYAGLQC